MVSRKNLAYVSGIVLGVSTFCNYITHKLNTSAALDRAQASRSTEERLHWLMNAQMESSRQTSPKVLVPFDYLIWPEERSAQYTEASREH